jgi:group I intron endonuclease
MNRGLNYVYLTTNLISGKQYIGDHTINPNERKYYLGSGRALKNAMKKYGRQNFFKEILEWFPTKEESFSAQKTYIEKFNTLIPNGYNISLIGGLGAKGCQKHTPGTIEKIRKSRIGKYKGVEAPFYGKHHTEETKSSIENTLRGIELPEETKRKMRKPRTHYCRRKNKNSLIL